MADLQFITGYNTKQECEQFLQFAYGMIDLLKATNVSEERKAQRLIALQEWRELRDKAEDWWLQHGGQEVLDKYNFDEEERA